MIPGGHPGDERQITVFAKGQRPLLLTDIATLQTSATSSAVNSIAARFDSTGAVHGMRRDGTSTLPDSVLTMRPDIGALHRMAQESKHTSFNAALTNGEQPRVRALAAWLLKRCP